MAAGTAPALDASRDASAAKQGGVWCTLVLLAVAIGLSMRVAGPAAARAAFEQLKLTSFGAVLCLLAACYLSMLLHECGHLAAALWLRFDILGGSFGPFRAIRSNGNWRFQFSGKNVFRGSVVAAPEIAGRWRASTMAVIAAGPVTTLLAGIISAAILAHESGAHPFCAAMTVLNLLLFALSLVPFQGKAGAPSDAKLLLALLQNGREAGDIAACFLRMRERALTPAGTSRAA